MASLYTPPDFSIGDQVSVNLELDVFQALQGGHSRWKPEMAKCMGRVGNVLGMGPGYVEVSSNFRIVSTSEIVIIPDILGSVFKRQMAVASGGFIEDGEFPTW